MTSLLEFECRVPVDGYRIMVFDERKFEGAQFAHPETHNVLVDENGVLVEPDYSVLPPSDATEDELYLLRRWGTRIVPWVSNPQWREDFFEGTGYEWEPELKTLLEPQSEKLRCFDLFEGASSPYENFLNTPAIKGDVEGPKALADRFGPLHDGPQWITDWTHSIKTLQSASKVWKKADQTGDFKLLIRGFSQKGLKLIGRNRIDASISLREDPQTGAARLCIRPETLLDALWTQLVQAIDGSQSLQNCVQCKSWFTIKAGQGRSDKEYCSDACRMRAYRKRKGKH